MATSMTRRAVLVALAACFIVLPASRFAPTASLRRSLLPERAHAPIVMGRAEKRMAKKRAAKGQQYQGGRPLSFGRKSSAASADVLPRSTVPKRLREVPVFGVLAKGASETVARTEAGYVADAEGFATFYMDASEAATASARVPGARVLGVPLDEIYFDQTTRIAPAESAMKAASTIPASRAIVPDVRIPLYCIDGMQVMDKESNASSLPLFFSKDELLAFAGPVYGAKEATEKVLITDLDVVVTNMIRGPAGLLRDAKFFADAKALAAMDKQEVESQRALFPAQPGNTDAKPPSAQQKGMLGAFQGLFPD